MKKTNKIKKVNLEELYNVLEFYADKETYQGKVCGYEWISKIEDDKGSRAREILKRLLLEEIEIINSKL